MPKWTSRALRDLEKVPSQMRPKILAVANQLDSEPATGSKLRGKLEGLRSARVGRSYRVLYETSSDGPIILTVGPRKDIYR